MNFEIPLELIVSSSLLLKQFSLRDVRDIFLLIDSNREHLSQFGEDTSRKYQSLEEVTKSITNPLNPKKLRFGIWANEVLVGSINLTPFEGGRIAEIGYYLGSQYTGKGYMFRAVDVLTNYAF